MSLFLPTIDYYRELLIGKGFQLRLSTDREEYAVLDAVGQPVFVLEDRSTNVIFANEQAQQLVRSTNEESEGRVRFLQFSSKEEENELLRSLHLLDSEHTIDNIEVQLRKGKEISTYSVRLKLLKREEGFEPGVSMVFTNIERYVAYKEELMYAKEDLGRTLKSYAQMNSDITYAIAHDLRAPIRHIQSFSALLKTDILNRLNDAELYLMNTVIKSSRKLGRMVDSLVLFTRIDINAKDFEVVDLNELVQEVCNDYTNITNNVVRFKIEEGLPKVYGVHKDLNLAFYQVLLHVVEFALKNGLSDEPVEVVCMRTNFNTVSFTSRCSETLSEREVEKLFEIFQHVDNPSEDNIYGVGLAMAKKIINLHSGKILVGPQLSSTNSIGIMLPIATNL